MNTATLAAGRDVFAGLPNGTAADIGKSTTPKDNLQKSLGQCNSIDIIDSIIADAKTVD